MEKINVAELLKDCPSGMELDCTMYDNLHFDKVDDYDKKIHCYIQYKDHRTHIMFGKDGTYNSEKASKCVIFPKGKTTWEGFHRPFKDGDIIHGDEYSDATFTYVAILKQIEKGGQIYSHCFYNYEDDIFNTHDYLCDGYNIRFATEEERQKLFQEIKYNGYEWNAETKTLKKLPMFKVGDRIKLKGGDEFGIITEIADCSYTIKNKNRTHCWPIKKQDDWELVPDKFDITTLKPFDKVLVRNTNNGRWSGQFYMSYDKNEDYPFECTYNCWMQCIPYEGNEHLRGKTDDCNKYFKTWE